jgi:hypothetical protein
MRISEKIWFQSFKTIRKSVKNNILDAGRDVRTAIIRRTTDGRDITGTPFTPYSEWTFKKKGTRKVTLIEGGDMLSDLRVAPRGEDTEVGFATRSMERRARMHQFGIGRPRRAFFGLSRAQDRRLRNKHEPLIAAKILEHDRRTKMRIDLVFPV